MTYQTIQNLPIMKKTAVLLAALVTGAVLRAADAAPAAAPATTYTVTADFPYVSSYVFRGVKLADDSFQPSLKLTAGSAYAGVWLSQPVNSDFDNEIDFYGGYSFALSGGWSLDVGGTLYYYPELEPSAGDESTFEAYVGLNGTVGGVTVGGYVYHDFTLKVTTLQGSIGYSIPVNDMVSINFSGNLGYVTPDEGDEYTYYGASVQLPWKISDKATVTIGGSYANNNIDNAEDDLFWANVGFTYTF
jgi:uncharacterized protein (TIGR02001 family)